MHANKYIKIPLCVRLNKSKNIKFSLSDYALHILLASLLVPIVVLLLDGNSEYVAYARRKLGFNGEKNPICECSRPKQMP